MGARAIPPCARLALPVRNQVVTPFTSTTLHALAPFLVLRLDPLTVKALAAFVVNVGVLVRMERFDAWHLPGMAGVRAVVATVYLSVYLLRLGYRTVAVVVVA